MDKKAEGKIEKSGDLSKEEPSVKGLGYVKCLDCEGTGILNEPPWADDMIHCPACKGAGEVKE